MEPVHCICPQGTIWASEPGRERRTWARRRWTRREGREHAFIRTRLSTFCRYPVHVETKYRTKYRYCRVMLEESRMRSKVEGWVKQDLLAHTLENSHSIITAKGSVRQLNILLAGPYASCIISFRARRMFSCLTQHTPCLKSCFTIFTRVPANPACW